MAPPKNYRPLAKFHAPAPCKLSRPTPLEARGPPCATLPKIYLPRVSRALHRLATAKYKRQNLTVDADTPMIPQKHPRWLQEALYFLNQAENSVEDAHALRDYYKMRELEVTVLNRRMKNAGASFEYGEDLFLKTRKIRLKDEITNLESVDEEDEDEQGVSVKKESDRREQNSSEECKARAELVNTAEVKNVVGDVNLEAADMDDEIREVIETEITTIKVGMEVVDAALEVLSAVDTNFHQGKELEATKCVQISLT